MLNSIRAHFKKMTYKQIIFYTIIVLCFAASVIFIYHNDSLYDRPIAKVTHTKLVDSNSITDRKGNHDKRFTQHITAKLQNGDAKGKMIHLTNQYSASGSNDQKYHKGNKLFVSVDKNEKKGKIKGAKRDQYVLLVAWAFIFTLLIVGKKKGLFSIVSLAVNAALLSYALNVYIKTENLSLLTVASISVIFFAVISLIIVSGLNTKTYAAIIATLLGTFLTLAITAFVMWATSGGGLRYEEMQFLTRPYRMVFMAGLLLGALGGIMDVAITMSSSIFGMVEKNHNISQKALKISGTDIGKDIMGTLTNILLFVYISGSAPMMILYLNNASSVPFTISMNLSLELARSLAGGIGIVLTIPIALYTSIYFVQRKRERS